jgi:LEA14-like dessication related protein
MMNYSNRKKTGILVAGFLLLISLLATWLYFNRKPFYPEVEEVTYLQVKLGKDTTAVQAGIRVRNLVPFSFQIDSVSYQIRSKGVKIGWGNYHTRQILPGLQDTVLTFQLLLDQSRYRKLLAQQQNRDSLEFEVQVQLYIDPPLLKQQTISINRTLRTVLPKKPVLQIDTFFVKSFSPEAGYTFQLNLNTGNANLPDLQIKDLQYKIKLADSIEINGKIDTVLIVKSSTPIVQVPVHLKTAELIEGLALKLGKRNIWPYEVQATATLETDHHLFENTAITVTRSGTLNIRKIGGSSVAMPSVKKLKRLQLVKKDKNTYLEAEILVHNPTKLPLYIDSARYFVRSKGKVIASGSGDYEKVFPAKGNQLLKLKLTVNNQQYKKLMAQPKEKNEIPLDVDLRLLYNLKNSKPQQLAFKKKITVPVTQSPSFDFVNIGIKDLDPEKGAQLLVKFRVQNKSQTRLQLDDLKYRLVVKNDIEITGKTKQPIVVDFGTTELEIPVDLSGPDVNQVAKGLIQGIESWPYLFSGTATVSTPNSLLHNTEIMLNTSGVYTINSKGTPDYMPEISKIDTLNVTIHYDTAWVHMYAAIYNTLPATVHISKLQVDVIHQKELIARSEEKLDLDLAPNANSFAWHTLGINYGLWEKHVNHHQHEDSIQLNLPVSLFFDLGNLGKEQAALDLSTRIPTPGSPVTLLQRLKLRGFSFRTGLTFDALVVVQNANSPGLTIKNIAYQVTLENGVALCGKINRTYNIPLGASEVQVPINLSIWEALKLLKRKYLGPPLLDYKINATAQLRTDNPKLSEVFVIFENWNQSDLRKKKLDTTPLPVQ